MLKLQILTQGTSETLKKLYRLNLSNQQEREYESQQKKSPYHLMYQISLKQIKSFSLSLSLKTQD